MILSLCFISPILGSQLNEEVRKYFRIGQLVNDSSPSNYREYLLADKKIIKKDIKKWLAFLGNTIIHVNNSMQKIKNENARAINYANQLISKLEESRTFISTHIFYSMYPYISHNVLKERINTFMDICNILKYNSDFLVSLTDSNSNVDYQYEMELSKINTFLHLFHEELAQVLLHTFITIADNAKEHQKIHGRNNINTIIPICVVCSQNINKDDYVFSFLCGHQSHLSCGKPKPINVYGCLICKKDFWDEIDGNI